jgi:methionyl-tRNA formyltransferase|tara:strand:- start:523 stop:1395 length:873 start_codon:yes stop_codon:yes gene_type:complete
MNLGVLTSGNLGRDTLENILVEYNVSFVLTDSKSEGVIALCDQHEIPCFKGNPRNGKGFEFIKDFKVDVIVSINYLFLIETDIIHYSAKLTFNIHGSLLPKYRGRTPHVWAIINNEKETGITAHLIDEGCDTGPILDQIVIPIGQDVTGNDILNKYKLNYFGLVQNVLNKIETDKLVSIEQDDSLATYFGARRPTDGLINWNWQKERIRNWVRAQSYPYPGAFTFFNGQKITIDKVEEFSVGFNYNIINGTILEVKPNPIIKTQNGALIIKDYREKVKFIKGAKLDNNEK